jgi:hypothetical protein
VRAINARFLILGSRAPRVPRNDRTQYGSAIGKVSVQIIMLPIASPEMEVAFVHSVEADHARAAVRKN